MKKIWVCLMLCAMLMSACNAANTGGQQETSVGPTTPTPYPEKFSVTIPPYIPAGLREVILQFGMLSEAGPGDAAPIILDVSGAKADIFWVYALAAPFSYIGRGVSSQDLERFWRGDLVSGFPAEQIVGNGSTVAIFEKVWGAPDKARVRVVNDDNLLIEAWETETIFALLPFEDIGPAWQVLEVDGQSPLRKAFSQETYPLVVPFSFIGNQVDLVGLNFRLAENQIGTGSISNRQADQLTTVITTGVTALVRATAFIMEASGMTYPAIDIGDILREADILHINNEVPFAETCPKPFANPYNDQNMIFCSKPEYIQLLEAIGTDVVELAGDHFWDWGEDAMLYTIDLYEQHGWQYYGGGRNFTDGIQPALFDHNGNNIAFFGCNAKPAGYATASENFPGAAACDLDLMSEMVAEAAEGGYLPIFTFQHTEYYRYDADESLREDFLIVADAGAVVVQGSQAHQPHAMEFYKNSFMHYGLGNLFFDQYYESAAQREGFIDRHVFYDGKYITTELIPIQFIDNARPRLMTETEREALLTKVFTASGW